MVGYPNLFVIGVHKGGSTSLFNLLSLHPEVKAGKIKEPHFYTSLRYNRNLPSYEKYLGNYSFRADVKYVLDASPSYFYGGKVIIDAILKDSPRAKFIIILREPTDRFISYYRHCLGKFFIPRSKGISEFIEESINHSDGEDIDEPIWRAAREGLYAKYLTPWKALDSTRLKIVFFDDLKNNPQKLMNDLYSWAGIEPITYKESQLLPHNTTFIYKSVMLKRFVRTINIKAGYVIRKFPLFRRIFKEFFVLLNSSKQRIVIHKKDKERLMKFYQNDLNRLSNDLIELGWEKENLPYWLR